MFILLIVNGTRHTCFAGRIPEESIVWPGISVYEAICLCLCQHSHARRYFLYHIALKETRERKTTATKTKHSSYVCWSAFSSHALQLAWPGGPSPGYLLLIPAWLSKPPPPFSLLQCLQSAVVWEGMNIRLPGVSLLFVNQPAKIFFAPRNIFWKSSLKFCLMKLAPKTKSYRPSS